MSSLDAKDLEYLARSIELAEISVAQGGGPFGAVIVRSSLILAEATNRVTQSLDPTAHAEVTAIRAACQAAADFRLPSATIYSSCEPCPMCLSAIHWSRMDRIVFAANRYDAKDAGFDDELLYRELSLPGQERTVTTIERRVPQATAPFVAWKNHGQRTDY